MRTISLTAARRLAIAAQSYASRSRRGRAREVEETIRSMEDDQWRRTDPEKSARADDMVSKLEAAIADIQRDLDAARAKGDERRVTELEENLKARQSFLDMAKQVSADYSG